MVLTKKYLDSLLRQLLHVVTVGFRHDVNSMHLFDSDFWYDRLEKNQEGNVCNLSNQTQVALQILLLTKRVCIVQLAAQLHREMC